jgi:ferritin-like metal-binding protein YciE
MSVTDLRQLLEHELGDLLYAEKHILKALKKMVKEVSNPEIKARLVEHRAETEGQVQNLTRAFEVMGKRAKAQKCPGILGIIEEHTEFAENEADSPEILEAFNLGSGLRVEHYEIAAYRSAIAVAKVVGQPQVAQLLDQNLAQELAMARFLETNAVRALRMGNAPKSADAVDGASNGSRDGATTRGSKKGAKKGRRKRVARS